MCDGWVFILVCFFTEDALNQTCSLSSLLLACTRIIPLSFLIQMTILFLFLLLYSNPASQRRSFFTGNHFGLCEVFPCMWRQLLVVSTLSLSLGRDHYEQLHWSM